MRLRNPLDYIEPFRIAMNGIVYTFRTQRHMRFHLFVVMVVIVLGMFLDLGMRELLVLLFTISLVLVAEMFNSAIEATVDLVSPNYHPMAKFAKDISAGAVLITTLIALTVGGLLIVGDNRWERIKISLMSQGFGLPVVVRLIVGCFILFIVIVVGKGLGKSGQILRGGLVSGHAAYGFFFAISLAFLTDNVLASGLAVLLAAIIAQSRYEAKFHTVFELTLGAGVGTVLALLFFGLMPR